ncbi:DUF2283 domain-containing protein [Sphingorhabdus sp. SMR4y]|uniref:DUF2283 domain-containing protein n=1 Tax=Sphingorhabdus sp. SMR4y TaxID=2584094 RepID=UPI000B604B63|nr:DUF2283 domain-containing protein [Sphingorhabdus sp. SMR4y]ASK88562.1 hypothetical protein SPHFLASMR4Y_01816 [Sphingorhabdus sp. SMR4y]
MKSRSRKGRFTFYANDDENLAFIQLPAHPKKAQPGIAKKQLKLSEHVNLGRDIEIFLDFDKDENPISIEILTYDE